ncbi:MAG TPA: M4 family metallopeptidase [Bacteroidales bacterium]|jgi:Zn-dependent metalloprotease|nr:M4 family metallopeptidase [Bacteroidales bacterium]HNZ42691.1 M4 family metallopeptidase [Bacteroidales bacterium]HPB25477.1 M4 family metallopeptidase [Bacteroidales bacterium]HPI29606.1 M4 family metallopeptidase [Bacteroidales bacterium]HQN16191.1 M4 family metallopeptidase [Bacteroidales bacterium]
MKKILAVFAISTFISVVGFSQVFEGINAQNHIIGSNLVRYADHNVNPTFIRYNPQNEPLFQELDSWLKTTFNIKSNMGYKLISTEKDKLGFIHYRYRQTADGIPVRDAVFIVHVYQDKIHAFNGIIYSEVNISNAFSITGQEALSRALSYVNAEEYMWQKSSEEAWIKKLKNNPQATFYPVAEKEIIYSEKEKAFRAAYKFDVYASRPVSRQHIYVDAGNGNIVRAFKKLYGTDVPATAVTKYSGTKQIVTDSVQADLFRLHESGRGNGIFTYNMQQQTNYNQAVDFTDSDNYWNNVNANLDEAATDAHWGAEMTYDYYWDTFGRNSIDGDGFALYNYVHYDQAYGNAYWNGDCMTYGDGENNNPFCALDVCAHEITHGLDEFTANLDYVDESGALNEGFSDIFGTAVEYFAKPAQANWTCGENIGFIIRNLQNPNAEGDPDTYLGLNWDPAQEVHRNSTVLSHWYYLLCQGGSGTNDNNDVYSVTGIGMNKASDIAFRMLTVYLINTSDYQDARFFAILAASELYGYCSTEVASVTNAMYAVGLGDAYTAHPAIQFFASNAQVCSVPLTVNFENQTINANHYMWYFGDGATDTTANPSHTYTSFGNFDVKLVATGAACGIDSLTQTGLVSIDAANSNYASMPVTGNGQALTCCTGTLFDSGGLGDYSNNTNGTVTIAPTGASNVTLNFTSFDFESGYDYLYIYDGPTTASTLIGQYDGTNLPNGGTIQSSTGQITLRQTTDQGLTTPGFELTWHCSIPSTPPVTNFMASETTSCTGVIQFLDLSFNGPVTWHWDFGDGDTSNQQNPLHAYQAEGTYTVTLTTTNNFGDSTKTLADYIVVQNLPAVPSVTPGAACDSSSVILTASGTGQINWYDMETGGTLLYVGDTFQTPVLYQNTTFYVENALVNPDEYVGKTSKSNDAGLHNNNNYFLIFDCYTPMILKSVKVYAGDEKYRIIELRDSNGIVLQTINALVPAGESRVTLNFNLPVKNNMSLACGTDDPNMYRDQSGITFPYNLAGKISIKGTNAAPNVRYYYYYDWEVQEPPCISPRVPVLASVYACNGLMEPENINNSIVYPNPANGKFFVEFTSTGQDDYIITVHDVIGKEVYSQQSTSVNGRNSHAIDCSSFNSGIYVISLTAGNYNYRQKIIVH